MSFGCVRFIDSFSCMNECLDEMLKTLKIEYFVSTKNVFGDQ